MMRRAHRVVDSNGNVFYMHPDDARKHEPMDLTLRLLGFKLALAGIRRELVVPVTIAWLAFCTIILIAAPLVGIWVLNTLFPALMIGYGFWEWLAMLGLMGLLGRGKNSSN
jgi:hypothetical protein